jgi:hypothetical protein
MHFTIKPEFIAAFKSVISSSISPINTNTSNPNEKVVELELKENCLTITTLEANRFKLINRFNVEQQVEGKVYINASFLESMTKRLPNASGVIVEVKNNELTYKVNGLGVISQALYSDQNAFKGFSFSPVALNNITENILCNIKLTVGKTSDTCLLSADKANNLFSVYDRIYETGFTKFSSNVEIKNDCTVYLPKSLLKHFLNLASTFDVKFCARTNLLVLQALNSTIYLKGLSIKQEEFEALDWIVAQNPSIHIAVNTEPILTAINWQTYGASPEDGIELKFTKTSMLVKGKLEEASEVEATANDFIGTVFSNQGLLKVLEAFGSKANVILSIVELQIGEQTIRTLVVSLIESTFQLNAILYQRARLI